jgi:hypothetical protein
MTAAQALDAAVSWWDLEEWRTNTAGGTSPLGMSASVSGSGAGDSKVAGTSGGVMFIESGATASSFVEVYGNASAIYKIDNSLWYIAFRMRLTTTPDAQAKLVNGIWNISGTKTAVIGAVGNLDTSHFVLQHSGNLAGTDVDLASLDTNWHTFELYGLADGKVYATIDGGAAVSGTYSSPPTDACYSYMRVSNGTTAANQHMELDWQILICQRVQ